MRRTALFMSVAAIVMLLASGAMAKDCENEEVKRQEKLDKALGKCGDDADCTEAKRQKCRDKLDKHGCDSSVCDPPSLCGDSVFPECGGDCPPDEECGEVAAPPLPPLGVVAGTVCACVEPPPSDSCEGLCGFFDPAASCQCDEECIAAEDCCPDVCDVCPELGGCGPPPPDDSCEGRCEFFDPAASCQCDEECIAAEDCCPDACDVCPELGGCGGPVFCTQDLFECPDGSFVGRVPPDCEFAPCPEFPD